MANECIPFTTNIGSTVTCKTTGAVTGCRLVKITGNPDTADNLRKVAHATAGAVAYGVSGWDAASGAVLTVFTGKGAELPVTAGATITAGQELESNATGQVIPLNTGKKVGDAVTDAASGAKCRVKLA